MSRCGYILTEVAPRAYRLLPPAMASARATCLLLAIGLQESRLAERRQRGNGPARGLWQFELGTRASRGGVWGVFLHWQTRDLLRDVCEARGVEFAPKAIWGELEHDDVLAFAVARLLLWTVPEPLPAIGEVERAWQQYLGAWRPGRPHPETWQDLYSEACRETQSRT